MTEAANTQNVEQPNGSRLPPVSGYLPNESTAATSGDGVASQRSRGRDECSLTPYYDASGCTIYHGDCRELLRLFSVDLVLTDPPYGVSYSTWDKTVPRPQDWLYAAISIAQTVYVTPGNGQSVLYPHPTWTMAWFRNWSPQRVREGKGFSYWEPILVYGKNIAPVDAKIIKAARLNDSAKDHPCAKPIELFSWLISPIEFQTVLDPFMGSGTTLRASKDLGRRAIGIEIEERYCEIAAKRLEQEVLNFTPSVADTQPTLAACARGSRNTTAQADNDGSELRTPAK